MTQTVPSAVPTAATAEIDSAGAIFAGSVLGAPPAPGQTAADFAPEVLSLFDKYVHGVIPRREFLRSAAKYAVAGLTAEGLLNALAPRFAEAQFIDHDDARISAGYVEHPSPKGYGTVKGYLARPARTAGRAPTVLVVHENRGLNPHIEDIARRLAVDGFIAFAPDALHPLGGYPGDEDKARELFPKLDQAKTREDFIAAAGYLRTLPQGNGKVGVVGFCYGGGVANFLATRIPDLAAAVPFYGGQPTAEEAARIKAPLLIHYAGNDERINAGWPAYEAALKAARVRYEAHFYPGAQHGFNNNTTPRFDATAASLAWQRTIAFFRQHLADGARDA
ncbi:dienelactone hydrolase family protein [Azoarcus olearius]|uniref:dienelactone hydrolase family protein n=1 Tax=Azoarcus sp. (strain BH72) TaxID=418699 RepID=UPI000806159F|nr:dienelactone hydrolase family protein [Azoarcus olearius]ANQ85500.1 dienelactone hydrolase family protein [Azoarcus olearius]